MQEVRDYLRVRNPRLTRGNLIRRPRLADILKREPGTNQQIQPATQSPMDRADLEGRIRFVLFK